MYIPQAQVPDAFKCPQRRDYADGVGGTDRSGPGNRFGDHPGGAALGDRTPVTDVESMEDIVSISNSRRQVNMLLMSVFGGSALLLAAIGIYGLMAYSVQQRTQEIGIRMAMGAEPGEVKAMVIKQGMTLVIAGVVVGLGAAYFLANVLASVLFEVEPRDVAVF